MKKRRALLLILLALLLLVGIPTGLLVREYRREQASKDLMAAITAEDTDKALAALEAGADPNSREASLLEPSSFAERCQQLFCKLLHRPIPFHPTWGGRGILDERRTALMFYLGTSLKYDVNFVQALLDAGADPNATNYQSGISPLIWTVYRNDYRTTRLLLARGADINHKDNEGKTPLDWSVELKKDIFHTLRIAGAKTSKELSFQSSH